MIKLDAENLPLKSGCVLTIGNFDGVHLGHQSLIGQTAVTARSLGLPSLVLTFDRHPQSLLFKSGFKYLLGAEDKEKLVAAAGADLYYPIDFNKVRRQSPAEFVEKLLVNTFSAKQVVCGYNFSFGKGGTGTPELLKELLATHGVECTIMPQITVGGEHVSSTRLRALIAAGDMYAAAKLLGRLYSFNLPVVHGRQLGAKLGSPTINQLFPDDRALPAFGVYAALCGIEGKLYKGVANIGVKPTVSDGNTHLCETNIFDFKGDLYGKEVRVYLCKHLRAEKRFESLSALRAQIARDAAVAKAVLAEESFEDLKGEFLL
ncbi:MAG: bifunctional riboflavin kinase/FAD synthetase [Clostridia bacterium]|nr:bifunctional riboflavin kinase/FAD synthetase [Clostridia bacterium]